MSLALITESTEPRMIVFLTDAVEGRGLGLDHMELPKGAPGHPTFGSEISPQSKVALNLLDYIEERCAGGLEAIPDSLNTVHFSIGETAEESGKILVEFLFSDSKVSTKPPSWKQRAEVSERGPTYYSGTLKGRPKGGRRFGDLCRAGVVFDATNGNRTSDWVIEGGSRCDTPASDDVPTQSAAAQSDPEREL